MANAHSLAQEFDELVMFDEMTTGTYDPWLDSQQSQGGKKPGKQRSFDNLSHLS